MKQLKEISALFPEKNFRNAFEAKIRDLKARSKTDEGVHDLVLNIEKTYQQLCGLFDGTVERLRQLIEQHSDFEVDDLLAEEIEKMINEYSTQVHKVDAVDIGTPDIRSATQNFNSIVASVNSLYIQNKDKRSSFISFVLHVIQEIKLLPFLSDKKIEEYNDNFELMQKISRKRKSLQSAIEVAESLLSKREPVIEKDVEKKIDELSYKAGQHNTRKIWGWFLAGCLLGAFAAVLLGVIILKYSAGANFGEAMLRLGLVSVVLYFSFYCMKQFSIHRHLFQIYSFKAISLRVMLDLRRELDDLEKKLVLAKGIEAIFCEPSTGLVSQPTDHQSDYWQSVQRMLERLVTKSAESN